MIDEVRNPSMELWNKILKNENKSNSFNCRTPNMGWQCPACLASMAPGILSCLHCAPRYVNVVTETHWPNYGPKVKKEMKEEKQK